MTRLFGGICPHRLRGSRSESPCNGRGKRVAMQLLSGESMSHLKLIVPAAILLGGFLVCTTASYGKPEYVKTTKKACTYCHVDSKAKPKELTDAGKYYSEHKTLDGYTGK